MDSRGQPKRPKTGCLWHGIEEISGFQKLQASCLK